MTRDVPFVCQSEAAECGLACSTMIANYHGNGIDLSSLRRKYSTSMTGMNLRSLIIVLEELGFNTRPIRFELEYLRSLTLPCILHWGMNHYVVLVQVTRTHLVVNDPAVGRRRLRLSEAGDHLTGVALECSPGVMFSAGPRPPLLKMSELWRPHRGFGLSMAGVFSLVVAGEALALTAPFVTQVSIDRAIPTGDLSTLVTLTAALIFFVLCAAGLQLWQGWKAAEISSVVSLAIERNVFRHLMKLPTPFLESRTLGDTLNRLDSLQPIRSFLAGDLIVIVVDAIVFLITLVLLLYYRPDLACIPAAALFIGVIARLGSLRLIANQTAESIRADSRERTVVIETIRSHRAIKLFGREVERLFLWQNAVGARLRAGLALSRQMTLWGSFHSVVNGVEGAILLLVGGWLVAKHAMTFGAFIAFSAYATMFSGRGASLLDHFQQYRLLRLHRSRVGDIVKTRAEGSYSSPFLGRQQIELIALEGATFRYTKFSDPVLLEVTIRVPQGAFVLITGPSGGGKSTLFKVMSGLLPPQDGKLLVNGLGISSFGLQDYRQRIGVVMQDDSLLSGSVIENVSFFHDTPDIERIREVCRLVNIDSEILKMPMGYRSYIGDMGSILSGGQRQRILIARALYHNPDYIFMDEGTANLDEDNERHILSSLKSSGKTIILVSHGRLAHAYCDQHWEVRDGAVYVRRDRELACALSA